MDFIMIEHTSFSNPDWVDQKGNSRIVPANIDTFEAIWTCIPYLQLCESMRKILITLLEQKTLKLKKNPWWRWQMSHILPHRWFKMWYRSLAACPTSSQCLASLKWRNTKTTRSIFPVSQINRLKSSGSGHLDGNSRQLRLSYVAGTSFLTLELEVGRHYASHCRFFSTIATLPWLSPPSQHLWLTRHVNFTLKYSICLPTHRQINPNYLL